MSVTNGGLKTQQHVPHVLDSWMSWTGFSVHKCWGARLKEQRLCSQHEKVKTKAEGKIGGIMNVRQWDSGWQTLSSKPVIEQLRFGSVWTTYLLVMTTVQELSHIISHGQVVSVSVVMGFTALCLTWAALVGDGLCRNFALDSTRGMSQQGERTRSNELEWTS